MLRNGSVQLYEDNAGGLYLNVKRGNKIYCGLELAGSEFYNDAVALLSGNVDDWTVDTTESIEHHETKLIAVYNDGQVYIMTHYHSGEIVASENALDYIKAGKIVVSSTEFKSL